MLQKMKNYCRNHGVKRSLKVRVGIHSGICTVENFGSEDRLDFTVIGNNVNHGSRLEINVQVISILISEDTYLLVKEDFECEVHASIKVKGVSSLYKPMNLKK